MNKKAIELLKSNLEEDKLIALELLRGATYKDLKDTGEFKESFNLGKHLEILSLTIGNAHSYYKISENTYVFLGDFRILVRENDTLRSWPIIEL